MAQCSKFMLPSMIELASAWLAGSAGYGVSQRGRECLMVVMVAAAVRDGASALTSILVTAAEA